VKTGKGWQVLKTLRDDFRLAMVMLLSCCAIVAIAPFAISRALSGEWLLAALDSSIVIGMGLLLGVLWKSRRVDIISLVMTGFYTIGAVVVVYFRTESTIYWLYPVFIANYFVLRVWHAAIFNGLALLAISPLVLQYDSILEFSGIVTTLLLVNALAGIFSWKTEDQHQMLLRQATIDPLTDVSNRRSMHQALDRVCSRFSDSAPVSVILLDLDHFKTINDDFGHDVGDEVLRRAAELIKGRLRDGSDSVYRYGGEEFLILLRKTGLSQTAKVAESLRNQFEVELSSPKGAVTASFGCAELQAGEHWEPCVARADRALYAAKHKGRNAVVTEELVGGKGAG
jgi:diguanylate cyclase (GGDEF)-like protein